MKPHIVEAVAILARGGLVAFPTETVYGLGADARQPKAVAKIFAAKGRPADHPLIVHIADAAMLSEWADPVPDLALELAGRFWPGPLTLILKRAAGVLDEVTGGQPTVGLRVPNHRVALALLEEFKGGIAAPSANRFGSISPTRASHVREELGDSVDLIIDGGACGVGVESTILDLSGDRPCLLRPGGVSVESLRSVLGDSLVLAPSTEAPRVPGSLERHYSPQAKLLVLDEERILPTYEGLVAAGKRPVILGPAVAAWEGRDRIPLAVEHLERARQLYAALRAVDEQGFDHALVAQGTADGLGLAIADRLRRAAAS